MVELENIIINERKQLDTESKVRAILALCSYGGQSESEVVIKLQGGKITNARSWIRAVRASDTRFLVCKCAMLRFDLLH